MGDRTAIEELCRLLDEAFAGAGIEEGDESQALVPNLATVPVTAWRALPPGATRSHAGEINHLRSILGTDDRWRFIQQGFG
jgi:hypothetical protein